MYIPKMEATLRFFFFVRPRRFGKSLLLNMLATYYDKYTAKEFDSTFGELYIGKNPTEEHNKYLILHLDFSAVSGDSLKAIETSFNTYCSIMFTDFATKYKSI